MLVCFPLDVGHGLQDLGARWSVDNGLNCAFIVRFVASIRFAS